MSDFSASIKAILDTSDIKSQLDSIGKEYKIEIKTEKFDVNNIKAQMKSAGISAGKDFANGFNSSSSAIKTFSKNSANTIQKMQRMLASMKFDKSSIGLVTKDLEQMNLSIDKVKTRIDGNNLNISISGVDELGRAVTIVKQFDHQTGTISTVSKRISQSFNEVSRSSEKMRSSLDAIALGNKMKTWLEKNSKATDMFGDRIEALRKELNDLSLSGNLTDTNYKGIEQKFKNIQQSAISAGKTGKTLGTIFKNSFESIAKYVSVSSIISEVIYLFKDLYQNVYDIDTAMTNLYKVTDETANRYEKFLKSSSKYAQDLGRSVSSYIEQTANWSKLGYSLDEAEQLAKYSSVYANVAEIDDATAVSDMVTAMKAFNIEAQDAVTVIDPLNELGNNFAVSAADLGNGLTKAASAMATAGTDMHKTLAMITGGAEITQNAGEFGNFLKVASMRIRGMKGELEALGEEVDENVDSISKVQTQILNLTHGEVNIFDDKGEFREFYDIMMDISAVFDDLTSTERASLSEILFGKMRGNQGAALIQAFQSGQIQEAYEMAINSAGSASKEQERWMESLEAKTQKFESAWQSLSNTIGGSGFFGDIIDTGTELLNIIDEIIGGVDELGIGFSVMSGLIAGGLSTFADVGELIIQFQYLIILYGLNMLTKSLTNGNMNETMCNLVA